MSADVLREAERLMRERAESATLLAVADWLGNTAAAWTFSKVTPPGAVKAEAVARAYLGSTR